MFSFQLYSYFRAGHIFSACHLARHACMHNQQVDDEHAHDEQVDVFLPSVERHD